MLRTLFQPNLSENLQYLNASKLLNALTGAEIAETGSDAISHSHAGY